MLEDKISRRTFIKLGGLVAVGGLAAWLGLNALAPEYVQGPKKRYVTAEEYAKSIPEPIDSCPTEFPYANATFIYIKDRMVNIQPSDGESSSFMGKNTKITFEGEIDAYIDCTKQERESFKYGDIVIVKMRVFTADEALEAGYKSSCSRLDSTNFRRENTIQKA